MSYGINECFYSLQGEGWYAGVPSIFLRFAGCNLRCKVETHGFDCDTEFMGSRKMEAEEILEYVQTVGGDCKRIIFTGGEPLLQVDVPLCNLLKEAGYQLAVETNGSVEPKDGVMMQLNWVTCSPKVAEHAIKLPRCDEIKYVRCYGQALPKPSIPADMKLISPAFEGSDLDRKTLDWCIQLCRENPDWGLSVQLHKVWGVL